MKRLVIIFFFSLFTALNAFSVPSLRGMYTYYQPDGSSFKAYLSGDEWSRTLTTSDGCHVSQDSDGWYCYSIFDSRASLKATPYRVGQKAPREIISASRSFPKAAFDANVRQMRSRALSSAPVRIAPATKSSSDVVDILVLLVQFKDRKFTYGRDLFVSMLTEEGYSYSGASGSVKDYLSDQFRGEMDFQFTVGPVVTLSHPLSYYASDNDQRQDALAADAVVEACRLADSSIDFSRFDKDGDGAVDFIFLYVAGPDQAQGNPSDVFWSHQGTIQDSPSLDSKKIRRYALSAELRGSGEPYSFATIGNFCHEFGHILGLVDLYDTDYETGGKAVGLWRQLDIMDGGNYNNNGMTPPNFSAVDLDILKLGQCDTLRVGEYALDPIGRSNARYLRVNTDTKGEYYLIENRNDTGWDRYIGGNGLLVYHIDQSDASLDKWYSNAVNTDASHQCVDLVEANPAATAVNQVFFPSGKIDFLSPQHHPDYCFWSGKPALIPLRGISREPISGKVNFSAFGPLTIVSSDVFQDAAIISWETDSDSYGTTECHISWSDGTTVNDVQVKPYEPMTYSHTLENLKEKTRYTVTVYLGSGTDRVQASLEIMTKSFHKDAYPFIFTQGASRNSDGTFRMGSRLPLRVYDAPGARKVEWTLDGKMLKVTPDGYWTVQNGVLEAVVHLDDGSVEKLRKEIKVR